MVLLHTTTAVVLQYESTWRLAEQTLLPITHLNDLGAVLNVCGSKAPILQHHSCNTGAPGISATRAPPTGSTPRRVHAATSLSS